MVFTQQVSTYQMAVLLDFNAATEIPFSHLQASTQLSEVMISPEVESFVFCDI